MSLPETMACAILPSRPRMSGHVNWSYLDGVLAVWIGGGPIAHVGDPEAGIICEALSNLAMRAQTAENALRPVVGYDRPEISPGEVREWVRSLRRLADDMSDTAEGCDL